MRRTLVNRVERPFGITSIDFLPAHHRVRELERTILYALGIQPAVSAEVDIFEEQPEERSGDGRAGFGDLDGDVAGLREGKVRIGDDETERTKEGEQSGRKC